MANKIDLKKYDKSMSLLANYLTSGEFDEIIKQIDTNIYELAPEFFLNEINAKGTMREINGSDVLYLPFDKQYTEKIYDLGTFGKGSNGWHKFKGLFRRIGDYDIYLDSDFYNDDKVCEDAPEALKESARLLTESGLADYVCFECEHYIDSFATFELKFLISVLTLQDVSMHEYKGEKELEMDRSDWQKFI